VHDTTAKRATLRGGHSRAGQLMAKTPKQCLDCDAPMVPWRVLNEDLPEDHKRHAAHGYCSVCYYHRKATGSDWDGPPPTVKPQWRAADLVAEWEFLRVNRGCTRAEAAEILGVKPSTLGTAAHRARQYAERDRLNAERDKLRAEINAAEAEAHRINDDMIAYAIRKGRAA